MTEDELRAWIEKVNGNDLEEVRAAGLCALKLLMRPRIPSSGSSLLGPTSQAAIRC